MISVTLPPKAVCGGDDELLVDEGSAAEWDRAEVVDDAHLRQINSVLWDSGRGGIGDDSKLMPAKENYQLAILASY